MENDAKDSLYYIFQDDYELNPDGTPRTPGKSIEHLIRAHRKIKKEVVDQAAINAENKEFDKAFAPIDHDVKNTNDQPKSKEETLSEQIAIVETIIRNEIAAVEVKTEPDDKPDIDDDFVFLQPDSPREVKKQEGATGQNTKCVGGGAPITANHNKGEFMRTKSSARHLNHYASVPIKEENIENTLRRKTNADARMQSETKQEPGSEIIDHRPPAKQRIARIRKDDLSNHVAPLGPSGKQYSNVSSVIAAAKSNCSSVASQNPATSTSTIATITKHAGKKSVGKFGKIPRALKEPRSKFVRQIAMPDGRVIKATFIGPQGVRFNDEINTNEFDAYEENISHRSIEARDIAHVKKVKKVQKDKKTSKCDFSLEPNHPEEIKYNFVERDAMPDDLLF